jgi:hypothetical protein
MSASDKPIDRLVKEGRDQRSVLPTAGPDHDVGSAPLHRRIVQQQPGGTVWRLRGSVSMIALR